MEINNSPPEAMAFPGTGSETFVLAGEKQPIYALPLVPETRGRHTLSNFFESHPDLPEDVKSFCNRYPHLTLAAERAQRHLEQKDLLNLHAFGQSQGSALACILSLIEPRIRDLILTSAPINTIPFGELVRRFTCETVRTIQRSHTQSCSVGGEEFMHQICTNLPLIVKISKELSTFDMLEFMNIHKGPSHESNPRNVFLFHAHRDTIFRPENARLNALKDAGAQVVLIKGYHTGPSLDLPINYTSLFSDSHSL